MWTSFKSGYQTKCVQVSRSFLSISPLWRDNNIWDTARNSIQVSINVHANSVKISRTLRKISQMRYKERSETPDKVVYKFWKFDTGFIQCYVNFCGFRNRHAMTVISTNEMTTSPVPQCTQTHIRLWRVTNGTVLRINNFFSFVRLLPKILFWVPFRVITYSICVLYVFSMSKTRIPFSRNHNIYMLVYFTNIRFRLTPSMIRHWCCTGNVNIPWFDHRY